MPQLTLSEVAKRFNVNRTTLYRAVAAGRISRLSNGKFDLSEVLRVFGEPASTSSAPVPVTQSNEVTDLSNKLIKHLESEVEFYKKQLEQKDNQLQHLQRLLVSPEAFAQRDNTAPSHDTTPHAEALANNDMTQGIDTNEANSNDTRQQRDTSPIAPTATSEASGLISRFGRGVRAFLK